MHGVAQHLRRYGGYAAGFVSYEAAPAFDPALRVRKPEHDFPLVWFGCFKHQEPFRWGRESGEFVLGDWQPTIEESAYLDMITRLKEAIRDGAIYQANFTYRLSAAFRGDALALFRQLTAIPAPCAAYLDIGRYAICAQSPELFFRLAGDEIVSWPMKGTAPRGLTLADDLAQADGLRQSAKNRAENLMIVDMVRNDLGRIADTGSVKVESLFAVERYPGLWQMTSSIKARTSASLAEIFRALFPSASITGAPKAAAMQSIASLESSPRKLYTGAIGYLDAERNACFSVAIRTLILDRREERAEFGTGGGIVWESEAAGEYEECRIKARSVLEPQPAFDLLETILWSPQQGLFLLDYHLRRLAASAEYFQFPWPGDVMERELDKITSQLLLDPTAAQQSHRLRLLLDRQGGIKIEAMPIDTPGDDAVTVRICQRPVDPNNRFLYHKTTHRPVHQAALAEFADGAADVVLHNPAGEVTETTTANLVAKIGGELVTPPVSCGLLPGTFRQWLLDGQVIRERAISVAELSQAEEFWLINSVRKWRRAVLLEPAALTAVTRSPGQICGAQPDLHSATQPSEPG